MRLLNPGETNKTANLELAVQVFSTIQKENPGTESAALAWGEIGKCYFQLATHDARNYEAASNAFYQVVSVEKTAATVALDAVNLVRFSLGSSVPLF